jgi:hypothetical protein
MVTICCGNLQGVNAPQSKTEKRFSGIPTPIPVAILTVWIFPKQQNYLFVYLLQLLCHF